jgi:hypothetical protein
MRPSLFGCTLPLTGEPSEGIRMIMKTTTVARLEHSTKMLASEFKTVPKAVIASEVEATAIRLLENARFDDFVPILTHRYVRNRLRQDASAPVLAEAA